MLHTGGGDINRILYNKSTHDHIYIYMYRHVLCKQILIIYFRLLFNYNLLLNGFPINLIILYYSDKSAKLLNWTILFQLITPLFGSNTV